MQNFDLTPYLSQIKLPSPGSKKGDNGRVLVIGGSRLFHSAAFWSASMASRLVDMVHFTSPELENNDLMRVRAKAKFWDGIVVPYEEVDHYIAEDDALLIGPGMERGEATRILVNSLLSRYATKRWVVDGGALQEVDPTLLTPTMILTPNAKELEILYHKLGANHPPLPSTVLAKGPSDTVTASHFSPLPTSQSLTISGGSPGLTKGGTGDVLSGLVAGLAATSDPYSSCVVASYTLKSASESLARSQGPYFSPTDLITVIPTILSALLRA